MQRTRPPVTVRPATAADAPRAATVITDALADKYAPALGPHARAAVAGLIAREVAEGGPSGYRVAEVGGRVVGALHLQFGGAGGTGFVQRLAEEVGHLRALRAALVFSLLGEGGRDPDEAYIDELGVDPAARRRGVAGALLADSEREARHHGRGRLTLWVTSDNHGARALYEGAGFRVARRRRWLVGRLVFGSPGALFMEKRLAPR